MPIEQDPSYQHPAPPDPHEKEMEQMGSLWQGLPDAHKVSLVLRFADTILTNEYRPYLLYIMAQRWPLNTGELTSAYPRIEITEQDLMQIGLDEEEIAQLTAEHRQQMAEEMRTHYIRDLFWPELRHIADLYLENLAKAE